MSYTDFKEVTSDNAGTTARYGGNDLKEIMQICNGKTVANRRPKILNEWIWLDHFDMKPPGSAPGNPSDANSSRIYADPTDNKIKVKKTSGSAIDIENVDIPDSALSTITNKSKLHSAIVYKDQNNDLGDFYLEFGDITAPSNPTTGKRRVFVDSATGELSVRTAAGTTVTLEGGGTGGGGDVFLNQSNTHGDFDNTFRSARLKVRNPANTFSYNFTGAAIAADRAITLPLLTAGDTLVTAAFAQTLTNKTLTQSNNSLQMWNTAVDRKYIFKVPDGVPSGADITIEWPNTTSNDSLVSASGSVAFTNKTINLDSNTVKHSTTNSAGDLVRNNGTKFDRLAKGTGLQVLRTNSGATDIEWASLDSERIGKHTANGNGSTTTFNIAHGIGATPTYAMVSVAASGSTNLDYSYTLTSTNIVVVFSSAPSSGTNNVVIYWIAVA